MTSESVALEGFQDIVTSLVGQVCTKVLAAPHTHSVLSLHFDSEAVDNNDVSFDQPGVFVLQAAWVFFRKGARRFDSSTTGSVELEEAYREFSQLSGETLKGVTYNFPEWIQFDFSDESALLVNLLDAQRSVSGDLDVLDVFGVRDIASAVVRKRRLVLSVETTVEAEGS